jgi:hypothetical protein
VVTVLPSPQHAASFAPSDTSFAPVLPDTDRLALRSLRWRYRSCSDVLVDALQRSCAGDWNDPGFLCKEPGERDLSSCGGNRVYGCDCDFALLDKSHPLVQDLPNHTNGLQM